MSGLSPFIQTMLQILSTVVIGGLIFVIPYIAIKLIQTMRKISKYIDQQMIRTKKNND